MSLVSISLTRALALIKSSTDLVEKLAKTPRVGLSKANGVMTFPANLAGEKNDSAATLFQATEDRFNNLIQQRCNLRLKVAQINCSPDHTVTFRGQQYTINQLMEKRNFEVTVRKALLANLIEQVNQAQQIEVSNATQIENRVRQSYNNWLTSAKQMPTTQEEADNVLKSLTAMEANNALSLVDPLNVREKIRALQDELHTLQTEIDFCLSEANGHFTVEVDASFTES